GVIQQVERIGKICREREVPFFSDTVQSFGRIEVPYGSIDFFTVSGHKINCPKGIGFLKVNKNYRIKPLITGGGQEFGLRAGTENTAGIIALGRGVEKWESIRKEALDRFYRLEAVFLEKLKGLLPDVKVIGEGKKVPYITTVLFPGVRGQEVVMALGRRGIAVSSGSACSSGGSLPSHVLTACGFGEREAVSGVRFSFGVDTTEEQVILTAEAVSDVYKRLKSFPF
ncbi:MAG: aminotransferase class V-fold PLP-dependent enzyme, partial [Aquificae bacterium]|nr:aminotransferase class V-fold PLP-dependent enzyme [Aquificota bacterium]